MKQIKCRRALIVLQFLLKLIEAQQVLLCLPLRGGALRPHQHNTRFKKKTITTITA
jgi:hypothetical protein